MSARFWDLFGRGHWCRIPEKEYSSLKHLSVCAPTQLRALAAYQRALLHTAVALLAPGGTLVYCTCTVNPDENEGNVAWALDRWAEARLGATVSSRREEGVAIGSAMSKCSSVPFIQYLPSAYCLLTALLCGTWWLLTEHCRKRRTVAGAFRPPLLAGTVLPALAALHTLGWLLVRVSQ